MTDSENDIDWQAEWQAVCSMNIRMANAARPFAEQVHDFEACGDGQPIGIRAVSGKSNLTVGDLRAFNAALIQPYIPASDAASEQAVAGEWQPIDTAPMDEEGTHVLIAQDGDVVEARFILEHGWWSRGNDPSDHWGEEWFPTHWMPLPAAPCITAADESSVGTKRSEVDKNPQGKGAEG